MSNDQKRMAEGLSKLESSNPEYTGDIPDNAITFIRRTIQLSTAATNANASNAIIANASPSQWRAPGNGRVVTAHLLPSLAATANDTSYSTVSAELLVAGVDTRALATQTTKTTANGGVGTLAPGVGVALTVTDKANARFTQGQIIAPKVAMTSSGVAMGAGTLELVVELEGPWDEAQ
jgi:hypothetical protein